MRIGFQGDTAIQATKSFSKTSVEIPKTEVTASEVVAKQAPTVVAQKPASDEKKDFISKEKLQEAVESINEFLQTQQKASKFVFHEGLDKYYVKLVDSETEEVIKEIPPECLLNAFYEMKKLAGMIVDEKI